MTPDYNHLNFHPPVLDKTVLNHLPLNLENQTVLDLGCGLGDWGYLLRTRKTGAFHVDGLDINRKYLDKIPPCVYNTTWIQDLQKNQALPSYDYVLCIQLLEHLTKENGYKLLDEIDNTCQVKAIVSTPHGYMRDPNHLSGWTEQDLEEYGYTCTRLSYNQLPLTLMLADKVRRFVFRKGTGKLLMAVKKFA